MYSKPAPPRDILFKVKYGKPVGDDTTEYVYHGEDSISSEYSLTEEEERKLVEDLTQKCKTKYYQYKAKFEQQQAEKGYFMPPKDMLRQAHDKGFLAYLTT